MGASTRASCGQLAGLQNPSTRDRYLPPAPIRAASQLVRASVCKTEDQGAIPWRHSMVRLVNQRTGRPVKAEQWGQHPYLTPCPVSTMAVQESCKLLIGVRFLGWAPILRSRSTAGQRALNAQIVGQHHGSLPFDARSFNGRTRAFGARYRGSTPRRAANHGPFGYWLGRHPLKVEKAGSKPPGATNLRAWRRVTRGDLKSPSYGVRFPTPAPMRTNARVAQWVGGTSPRRSAVSVRIRPRVPVFCRGRPIRQES